MSNLTIFAAIFLFWTALAASLMQAQLAASPVHRMRVPACRAVPVRAAVVAQLQVATAATAYN